MFGGVVTLSMALKYFSRISLPVFRDNNSVLVCF